MNHLYSAAALEEFPGISELSSAGSFPSLFAKENKMQK